MMPIGIDSFWVDIRLYFVSILISDAAEHTKSQPSIINHVFVFAKWTEHNQLASSEHYIFTS